MLQDIDIKRGLTLSTSIGQGSSPGNRVEQVAATYHA